MRGKLLPMNTKTNEPLGMNSDKLTGAGREQLAKEKKASLEGSRRLLHEGQWANENGYQQSSAPDRWRERVWQDAVAWLFQHKTNSRSTGFTTDALYDVLPKPTFSYDMNSLMAKLRWEGLIEPTREMRPSTRKAAQRRRIRVWRIR